MSTTATVTTLKLDAGSNLMLAIFQELDLISFPDEEPSATEYLKLCAPHIERLGRVFKFLGLAEASTSALGWKPTAHLLHIIGQRLAANPIEASHEQANAKERKLVESLFQLAGADVQEPFITDDFVFCVMKVLGLLQEGPGGSCKPTSLLQETFEDVFGA
jgi:hypothetical protein